MAETQNKKRFYEQNTFWSGAGIILSGVLGFVTQWITAEQAKAAMVIFTGLTVIFMRQAVEDSKPYIPEDDR